jgi:hypothetical protein
MNNVQNPGKAELVESVVGVGGGGAILTEGVHIITERHNIMMLPSGIAVALLGGFTVLAAAHQYADSFRRLDRSAENEEH